MELKKEKMYNRLLEDHGLRRTNFRKEVLSVFVRNKGKAIANAELESALKDFDRITLYRTLKSFENKGLIHLAIDTSGQSKYALCGEFCDVHQHADAHAHFHCSVCGETKCMDDISNDIYKLIPEGYVVDNIQLTFSGICSSCH